MQHRSLAAQKEGKREMRKNGASWPSQVAPKTSPAWHSSHSCAALLAPTMVAAATVCAAAPGGAVARCGVARTPHSAAGSVHVAHCARRAAAALCVGSNGARPVSTYSLHRPAVALAPTRPAALRRRRSCAAAATSGRARLAVAAAASGEPRPDFATKGEFTKEYALKYLYDGGAPGQHACAQRLG